MRSQTCAATAATLATTPVEQFTHTLHGMLGSYGVDFDVLALLMCIQNEDKALLAASEGW